MLYIYSGEVPEFDTAARQELGRRHTLTLIPVSPQERNAAHDCLAHLRHSGFHARLPGSRYYRDHRRLRTIIMNADAIYLMGGNTFAYLDYARHIGLFDIIEEFEANGGLVLAESAGSIILSPTIATALVPTTCPDEMLIEMTDFRGMGRIPFHVSPHFDPQAASARQELEELQALATLTQCPVWVLQDGEGLVLDGYTVIASNGHPQQLLPEAVDAGQRSQAFDDAIPAWAVAAAVAQ